MQLSCSFLAVLAASDVLYSRPSEADVLPAHLTRPRAELQRLALCFFLFLRFLALLLGITESLIATPPASNAPVGVPSSHRATSASCARLLDC